MGKYFIIQFKRLFRLMPLICLITALLFGGVFLVYYGIMSKWEQGNIYQKLQIGIVGTTDDQLLQAALETAKNLDATSMSIDFVQMEEKQAASLLQQGELSAYLVFPPQFLELALHGEIVPIRFISSTGSDNIISLVKDEFASVFANMLLSSEQGVFALENALTDYGGANIVSEKMNELALSYANMIFHRDDVYIVEELGVSAGLSMTEYMVCGLSSLFIFLLPLPFSSVLVQDRLALNRLLKSRGIGAAAQAICELGVYTLYLAGLTVIPISLISDQPLFTVIGVFPAVFCVAAMSYFLYSICNDFLGAVMLQLFTVLAMCFLSGCMYPIQFFPISVQKLSTFLPAAMVKNYFADIWYGEPSGFGWMLLGVSVLFVLFSVVIRIARLNSKKGAGL